MLVSNDNKKAQLKTNTKLKLIRIGDILYPKISISVLSKDGLDG